MELRRFLMQSPELSDISVATRFAAHWTTRLVNRGEHFVLQGGKDTRECIVLDGCVASQIHDREGKAVCVGLYVGADVITPNIARTREGTSLVSLEAVSDVLLAEMDSEALVDEMIASTHVRDWANGVLREELARKADREWCLAALGGADRLAWFRQRYAGYEEIFVHTLIASFLGVTPVTLSRLRTGTGQRH